MSDLVGNLGDGFCRDASHIILGLLLLDVRQQNLLHQQIQSESHKKKYMSSVMRKPVFRVSARVQHKPGCTAREVGLRLEISDLGSRGMYT